MHGVLPLQGRVHDNQKASKQCTVFFSLIYCFFASFCYGQEAVLNAVSFAKATLKFRKDWFKLGWDLHMRTLLLYVSLLIVGFRSINCK